MKMNKIVILDVYRKSPYRISKDTCGGYGTENDFGKGLPAFLLSRLAKFSLFWPPLAALNLLSEFLNNNQFDSIYSQDPNIIDSSVDFVFVSTSIVCCDYELKTTKELIKKFPNIKFFAFGSFSKFYEERYREIGVCVIDGEPEFLFQNYNIDQKNLNLFHANGTVSSPKKNPNNLSLPLWVNQNSASTKNFLFGYRDGYYPIIATRGCPYSCYEYCVYPLQQGRVVNAASPEKIIDDVNFINQKTRAKNFVFRDPVFSINKKYTFDLLNAFANKGFDKYSFTVETHLNNINEELAIAFYNSGVKWVKFGIESADMEVKKNVHRYTLDNDEQKQRVNICKKNKLKTVAMYILCQPEDNFDTHKTTIDYSKYLETDLAQFSLFTPYPGTPFYEKNQEIINEDDFEKFNQYNLVFKHKIFNNEDAKKELGIAYKEYYLNKILNYAKFR